ncbi:unnamed protein product [Eruca vesicaria subsp. sativa]|uniref:Uncharacterized protein n=1 Tax=Eruca vesicaria subsp. sativa TaxID=29727 RepID=A0ABC8JC71_ERUVS|nr:unnamed protein product [Eruca vesicaria subsp. sativa]
MYCLQVAAYHLFFNASRFFYIFHDISVMDHVGSSSTTSFLAVADTQQVQEEFNVTFSGVFLGSMIQEIADNVF